MVLVSLHGARCARSSAHGSPAAERSIERVRRSVASSAARRRHRKRRHDPIAAVAPPAARQGRKSPSSRQWSRSTGKRRHRPRNRGSRYRVPLCPCSHAWAWRSRRNDDVTWRTSLSTPPLERAERASPTRRNSQAPATPPSRARAGAQTGCARGAAGGTRGEGYVSCVHGARAAAPMQAARVLRFS